MTTLEQLVHQQLGEESGLASAIANYVSPASTDKYTGMPDSKALEITTFKDSTKFQFGNGIAFPGYEVDSPDAFGNSAPVAPDMGVGTTWSLIVLMQPILTALGFWRMEYVDSTGKPCTAVGVLPSANAIIRNTVKYYRTVPQASTPAHPIYVGLVVQAGYGPMTSVGDLAGRVRIPAASITTHLDAPDLVNQGMVASSLIGQSSAVNGNTPAIVGNAGVITKATDVAPFYQWAGPQLGTSANITSLVATMANDPTRFVEKPLKEDGSYDIARSATLDWVHGIAGQIENPLLLATIDAVTETGAETSIGNTCLGVIDNNVAPMLVAYTNISQQASLNLRAHALMEIEPEIGSPFMPFRGLTPHTTKITNYFKAFADVAAGAAHTFPASANDDGLLASATKALLKEAGPAPKGKAAPGGKAAAIKAGIDGATQVATTYFNPVSVGHRNQRKSAVRMNKADNKTARVQAKQATKQAKQARKNK